MSDGIERWMTVGELIERLTPLPQGAIVDLSVADVDGSGPVRSITVISAGRMVVLSDRDEDESR